MNIYWRLHTKPAREPHDANRSMQAIADLASKDSETRRKAQATNVSKSRERSKKREYLDPILFVSVKWAAGSKSTGKQKETQSSSMYVRMSRR